MAPNPKKPVTPTVLYRVSRSATHGEDGGLICYVLPLQWSLHYAMTEGQWTKFRERVKKQNPNWMECSCPKKCKANQLDEQWDFDDEAHTKVFLGAAFICGGCHWLKSPPFRLSTWLRKEQGLLAAISTSPHIIDCLGWTQEQVDALRAKDLRQHQAQTGLITGLQQQVKGGKAEVIAAPMVPEEKRAELEARGQRVILPWRIDLSALDQYGYSAAEISSFEAAMYKVAEKRLFDLG
jgi:hypothetical protein